MPRHAKDEAGRPAAERRTLPSSPARADRERLQCGQHDSDDNEQPDEGQPYEVHFIHLGLQNRLWPSDKESPPVKLAYSLPFRATSVEAAPGLIAQGEGEQARPNLSNFARNFVLENDNFTISFPTAGAR
jgi:hypothetical protein